MLAWTLPAHETGPAMIWTRGGVRPRWRACAGARLYRSAPAPTRDAPRSDGISNRVPLQRMGAWVAYGITSAIASLFLTLALPAAETVPVEVRAVAEVREQVRGTDGRTGWRFKP